MTDPGTTVGTQRNRVPATRPDRAGRGGRSGAALRAYERRQQRASIHTSDSAHGPAASFRPMLNGSAIAARIPFVALVIGLLALGLGLTLLLTTRSAGDSYDLSAAKAVNAELAQQRASLQRDVELAESAPELARKAAAIGMVPAKNPAHLVVGTEGGVQVIGKPAPADGAPVAPLDPPDTGSGEGSVPNATTQNPAQQSAQLQTPRSASQPSRPTGTGDTRAATPSAPNGAGTAALAEQLVPMSTPSAPSPGESSGDGQ